MLRSIVVGAVLVLAVGCGDAARARGALEAESAPTDAGGGCAELVADLFVAPSEEIGTVRVSRAGGGVTVRVDTARPWWLWRVHVYAGAGPLPATDFGTPDPARFTRIDTFAAPRASHEVTFAPGGLNVGCGEPLVVAVNAEVVRAVEGALDEDATAWAFGTPVDAVGSGWFLEVAPCCAPAAGCTRSQGYWKTHHAGARVPALDRDWPLPEGTLLCGRAWLELLATPPRGEAWLILAHQYVAARLNVAAGAGVPPEVDDALTAASALLSACAVEAMDRAEALDVAARLDDYNTGALGPGPCD